jgi:hypothetical protein
MTQISRRSRILMVLAAGLVLSAPLHAQETALFTWQGRVDRRVDLAMQGSSTSTTAARGQEYAGRFRVSSALPSQDGSVRVVVSNGRGEAAVVQQPSAGNGYRTIVRITDRSSGADRYQLTAYYTPAATVMDPRRNPGGYGRSRMNQAPAVLHWSGEVDADAEVRWQGASITQQSSNGNPLRGVRSSVETLRGRGNNGATEASVVSLRSGRGSVDIIQQPNQSNNWTTVVRIRDPQSGYGRYSFDLTRP